MEVQVADPLHTYVHQLVMWSGLGFLCGVASALTTTIAQSSPFTELPPVCLEASFIASQATSRRTTMRGSHSRRLSTAVVGRDTDASLRRIVAVVGTALRYACCV